MNSQQERKIGPEELREEVLQSVKESERRAPSSTPYYASVTMNISPEAIPFAGSDKQHLVNAIANQFGSQYRPPPIPPESAANLPVETLMKASWDSDQAVTFEGGRLQIPGSDRVTPIERLAFGEQALTAGVNGTSVEAEYLCKQLCLLLWESTNMTRRWDEFVDLVEGTAYRTATVVDLGFPLISLLSDRMQKFLNEDIAATGGLGQYMGFGSALQPEDLLFIPYCREIELVVAVVDQVSGRAEDCKIELLSHSRAEANRSRVKVASELDTPKHNDMVAALVRQMKS